MFVKVLVFILHVTVMCMGSLRPDHSEYEYYPELHGWLKIHENLVDFRTAKANCHREDALVAGPWTVKFKTAISKLQTKQSSLSPLHSGAALRKGSTGIPMEPTENKRCYVFLAGGSMDKVNCKTRLPYVCYASKSSCSKDEYKLNNVTGKCYKFHAEEKITSEAKRICEAEGGYLTKKISPAELEKLAELLKIPSSTFAVIVKDSGDFLLVGLKAVSNAHKFICEMASIRINDDFVD